MALPLLGAAIAASAVPSVVNGISSFLTNKSNQSNYNAAQERANAFARHERQMSQAYNSLENQYAQMARVGMNPNLLSGQSFQATSPVNNQPVSPPLNVAPQMPSETISQAALNSASARNQNENAISVRDLRAGYIRQQDADYEFVVANTARARAELPSIQKQVDVINATLDQMSQNIAESKQRVLESDARTQNTREETAKLREQKGTWKRLADAQYNDLVSKVAVNSAQRSFLLANKDNIIQLTEQLKFQNRVNEATYPAIVKLKFGEIGEQSVRVTAGDLQNGIMRFNLGQMQNYGEIRNVMGLLSTGLQLSNQLLELTPYERAKKDLKDFLPFSNNSPSIQSLPNAYGSGGFSSPSISF